MPKTALCRLTSGRFSLIKQPLHTKPSFHELEMVLQQHASNCSCDAFQLQRCLRFCWIAGLLTEASGTYGDIHTHGRVPALSSLLMCMYCCAFVHRPIVYMRPLAIGHEADDITRISHLVTKGRFEACTVQVAPTCGKHNTKSKQ